ncbi:MAG: TRAP transporter small permease [Silicimonas sp.]|nr:TRAP transporter small permease [Silicimonas sp.]
MTGGTLFETGILRVTTGLAIVAGLVLTAMAIVTVISINGRSLIWAGLAPVPGDFELVEIGCAVAVFGFLPYCHLYRGHVTVDMAVQHYPTPIFNLCTLLGDLVIATISVVVAWRLWFGLQEKLAYGETSMILGAPLWIGYALSFAGAVWMVIVAGFVLWRDIRHTTRGSRIP